MRERKNAAVVVNMRDILLDSLAYSYSFGCKEPYYQPEEIDSVDPIFFLNIDGDYLEENTTG